MRGSAQHIFRDPGGLLEAAMTAAGSRDKSETIREALRQYAGGGGCGTCRESAVRIAALEAELATLRAGLVSMATGQPEPVEGNEKRFISLLQGATPQQPVTRKNLITGSGYDQKHVQRLTDTLVDLKMAGHAGYRGFWAVPGADLAAGIREARKRHADYERKRYSTSTSPPVAARSGRAAAVAQLQETVPGLVPASELAAVPVFKAGPDVDCLHENMRIRKGVCPDCKQWVTK